MVPTQSRSPGRKITVRRSPVHGRGVFATRSICAGELICEYTGERITWDEAIGRHPRDPLQPNHTFYFDIGDGTVIDGAVGGNSARWINHSCVPNCEAEDHDGRIFIRATKPIDAGDELGLDYALIVGERHTRRLRLQYACRCGSAQCRGTMLAERRKRRATVPPDTTASTATDCADDYASLPHVNVRIFERPAPDALILSWREPGRCCYSEQRWELMDASAAGKCALSGKTFKTGERVFGPVSSPALTNQNARIAESSVNDLAELTTTSHDPVP
jgi:hypothetical protein